MRSYCALVAVVLLAAMPECMIAAATMPAPESSSAGVPQQAHDYRDRNFDYFVVGNPAAARATHTEFTLALMGGGGRVDAAFAAIARHAGNGHIVILRAVSDDQFDPLDGDYGTLFATRWGPVVSAETLVFHNRDASYDPRVVAALQRADGIFLAGGDQSNYIRYWKGTPVQAALNAHVKANRPIGGSSAGLAILGHYSYTAFDGGSMESKVALANPFDAGVTLESDFLHLRGLENVITDTHFSKRCRLGRLIVFLARIGQENRDVTGVGIDENSALLIDTNGTGRLAAGSAGNAWIVMPRQPQKPPLAGQPLTLEDIRIVKLGAESSISLRNRRIERPAAETSDSIHKGLPARPSFATTILFRDTVPAGED